MRYVAYISREGNHVLAEFPDCPGCQTFADSENEITQVAREALEGWLEAHLADGQVPPRPAVHYGAPLAKSMARIPVRPGLAAALNIRWARHDAGLSQKRLGELAGVSQQQIAKLEDPDENPSLETLAKVGRAVGLDVSIAFEPLERVLVPASRASENTSPTKSSSVTRESLRDEFLAHARASRQLAERDTVQHWVFFRRGRDRYKGPLLVISKPGRTVVHVKHVAGRPAHSRWRHIGGSDPTHVGPAFEIRIEGDLEECRAAFHAGFKALLA